jgi:hypothetical protein
MDALSTKHRGDMDGEEGLLLEASATGNVHSLLVLLKRKVNVNAQNPVNKWWVVHGGSAV